MAHICRLQQNETESVLALWQAGCVEAVGHELSTDNARQVLINLGQYVDHDQCRCYIAIEGESVIGFVTCYISGHPIEPGLAGEVEELYVQPAYRQQGIAELLVREAVGWLKQSGAGVIKTRVGVDEPQSRTFWQGLGWEQDTINFAIYSNVPADPVSQAVWDCY